MRISHPGVNFSHAETSTQLKYDSLGWTDKKNVIGKWNRVTGKQQQKSDGERIQK